jgi:hypothetical protein
MRARLLRPATGLALVSAAVLSLSASAATKPLVLTDAKGDAFLNDQGTGTFGSASGPSQDSKDIVSLTLAPLPGKACTGYTAVVELAGAPSSNTVYRVLGTTAKNTSLFWLQYDNNPVNGTRTLLRFSDGTSQTVPLSTPAKVDGGKIIFTVLDKDAKAAGEKLASLKINAPGVDVRTSTGALTVPSYDTLDNEDKSFKVCS